MTLPFEAIRTYRAASFRSLPERRIHNAEEAVAFVQERSFVFFWPNSNLPFPSLWAAAAGDRPVPDEHDDPGHITWDWKDKSLGKNWWYYGRALQKRNAMISLDILPYFYALSENFGSPEEDYLILYEEGRLTQESKAVYETLLKEGPLDSITLRKKAHLSNRENESRFNRALTELQADFKILPVGVSDAGAWHYAFIYDLVPRHYPDLIEQAHSIDEWDARRKLAEEFFRALGAAPLRDLARIFGWKTDMANRVVSRLLETGKLTGPVQVENQPLEWICHPNLLVPTLML